MCPRVLHFRDFTYLCVRISIVSVFMLVFVLHSLVGSKCIISLVIKLLSNIFIKMNYD